MGGTGTWRGTRAPVALAPAPRPLPGLLLPAGRGQGWHVEDSALCGVDTPPPQARRDGEGQQGPQGTRGRGADPRVPCFLFLAPQVCHEAV